MELHGRGVPINPFILCGVGAGVGLLFGTLMSSNGKTVRVEEVLVGVFGAFIGGEFLLAQFNDGVASKAFFSMASLGLAVGGAVVMLLLLRVMRSVVGPMRASKSKQR